MRDQKGKYIALGIALPVLLLAGAYLSGVITLWLTQQPLSGLRPGTWFEYYSAYRHDPDLGKKVSIAGVAGILLLPLLGTPLLAMALFRTQTSLYGQARFASAHELGKAGFHRDSPTALIVGKAGGRYLHYSGQQFCLLAAPTRSGKGVGIVIPNLLSYQGSAVVLDIKQENFELTSGYRRQSGQEVYLFNPFAEDKRSHRWNPLTYVSEDPGFRVSDLMSIANMLYPIGDNSRDRFWLNQAQNTFVAFALYLLDRRQEQLRQNAEALTPCTFGELYRLSSGVGENLRDYLQNLATHRFVSSACQTAFSGLLSQSDDVFSNIMATFKEPLLPWLSPVVDAATSGDDFMLNDVRKRKMTIYIGIQPSKLAESRLIVNLFFSQLINQNTKELPQNNPELKHQCLLLMDEFTSIGKVDIIAKAVSYMAGYNVRLLPIIQSLAQLDAVYGREHSRTLVTNHALQILYTPREQQDANDYSEMLGYTTVRKDSRTRARDSSTTQSEERRALMLPQELKAMPGDKEIFVYEGLGNPVLCKKIRYYQDKIFLSRLLPKTEVPLLDLGTDQAGVTHVRSKP
jgi:type IV secretion system protein VirD4